MVCGQRYSSFVNSNNGSNLYMILIQVICCKGLNLDWVVVGKGCFFFCIMLNK